MEALRTLSTRALRGQPTEQASGHKLILEWTRRPRVVYAHASLRYAMSSLRSFGFLMPAKTIFVPLMYFLGASK